MKALLKVGFYTFLLPSETDAAKAATLLAKSLPVKDHTYNGELQLDDSETSPEIEIKILSKPFTLVNTSGKSIPTTKPNKSRSLQIHGGTKQPTLYLK